MEAARRTLAGRAKVPDRFIGTQSVSLEATSDFEKLVADFYHRVHDRGMIFAEQFLGYHAAEDAVEDALEELIAKWNELLPEERTESLFLTIVYQRVVDRLRRDGRQVEYDDEINYSLDSEQSDPASEYDYKELAQACADWIAALSPRKKEVWTLVRELGYPHERAAATLGMSTASVASTMYRIQLSLRKKVNKLRPDLLPGPLKAMKAIPPTTSEADHE